jgi:TRAP transporter TAXI family solute receptor
MTRNIDRRSALKLSGSIGLVALAGCTQQTSQQNQSGQSQSGSGSDSGSGSGSYPVRWQLGTSSEGSGSFQIGSTMSTYFKRNNLTDTFIINPVVTAGTTATYRRLVAGQYPLGGSNTYLLEASPDSGPFSDQSLNKQAFQNIRQIRGYMAPSLWMAVKKGSGIQSWQDLTGKRVFVSSPGSGTRFVNERIIEETIGLDNIQPTYTAFGDVPQMFRSNQIAGALVYNINQNIPTGFVSELDSTVDWKPLPFPQKAQEVFNSSPYITLASSNAKWSQTVSQPFKVVLVGYMYVTQKNTDEKAIYQFTKLTHEHGEELANQTEIMSYFPDPQYFMSTLHSDIPVHPGAYRYYTEAGLWSEYDLTPPPEAQ